MTTDVQAVPADDTATALAVRLSGVHRSFRTGDVVTHVLRGVDFDVLAGKTTFLVGPSGCGKTTLLSVLCGTLAADAGDVRVLGHAFHAMSPADVAAVRARHIGFVFQQFNLLPTLTAEENVSVPLRILGAPVPRALEAARAALADVGLAAKCRERPSRLSGGQQQRVAIARALVHDPDLVVCDEPTSALDSENGRQVMELLSRRSGSTGRTVVVVTHDARTYPFADRLVQMEDGVVGRVLDDPRVIASLAGLGAPEPETYGESR